MQSMRPRTISGAIAAILMLCGILVVKNTLTSPPTCFALAAPTGTVAGPRRDGCSGYVQVMHAGDEVAPSEIREAVQPAAVDSATEAVIAEMTLVQV